MKNSDEIFLKEYSKICREDTKKYLHENNAWADGLTKTEAENRLKEYGYNETQSKQKKKWYNYFLRSLFSPFNNILLGIAIVLYYTDVIIAESPNYANIIVIIVLVLTSTILEFFEEYKSNKAVEKLKELVATTTIAIREKEKIKLPIKNIVPGDIVMLSAGDMIPADVKIIESKDFFVKQSTLTGESNAIKKQETSELTKIASSISELDTICFMGTNVVSGTAKAIAIHTGKRTYLASIAEIIGQEKPKSSFQNGVEGISKLLIRFMIILIPLVFLLNVWKHNLVTSFTFAVAIAIGITPLLLPVILSSSLSRGAVNMSKKKTIVKNLDAIQSFGAINILCTDKTGTLTEDKIVLEKYLDIKGNEDIDVLKYAFLNSYFQTGLKGNIDEAVVARAYKNGLEKLTNEYKKIDEIPFDFTRRRLSVVVEGEKEKALITKGAVEEIISVCRFAKYQGEIFEITDEIKENIFNISKTLNKDGLRVIAIAKRENIEKNTNFSTADESNMILIGFIGFLDPPKESAKISIEKLNNSGIRVIVLTGDNEEVTKSICEKVNINSKRILSGQDLERLSDASIKRLLKSTNIFAKLSPIQKARVVRLLKESGNIVRVYGRPE